MDLSLLEEWQILSLNEPNPYGDLPEIVVAASMMIKKETKTRVRVLVNLSSFSEILRSACG